MSSYLNKLSLLLVVFVSFFYLNRMRVKSDFLSADEAQIVRFQKRQTNIERVCLKYHEDRIWQKINEDTTYWRQRLRFDYKDGFFLCAIPKVATTTWMHHLEALFGKEFNSTKEELTHHGVKHADIRFELTKKLLSLPRNISLETAFNTMKSFTFVRNPSERLVSAYYQKMVRETWKGQPDRELRDNVIDRIMKIDPSSDDTTIPSPTDFVQYILNEADQKTPDKLDVHIAPQWTQCPFCRFDFDMVGKLESYQQDEDFIIRTIGLQEKLSKSSAAGQPLNQASRFLPSDQQSSEGRKNVGVNFYAQISKKLQRKVNDFYQRDFELFGYKQSIL